MLVTTVRAACAAILLAAFGGIAAAACPPDCVGGGGPATTDCFVAFEGMTATSETCVDGAACDLDGRANGVCTFGARACINVPGLPSCTPGELSAAPSVKPASSATAQALNAALAALDRTTQACTEAGVVKVPIKGCTASGACTFGLAPLRPGTAKLTVSATSAGKRDKDKLRLTCQPPSTGPSFSATIQEIFGRPVGAESAGKCAIVGGCHLNNQNRPFLEPATSHAELVNMRALPPAKLLRVKPGNIKQSYLAHKILGKGIAPGTLLMPQGCPAIDGPPTNNGCLTPEEVYAILLWIQNGAPND